MRQQLTIMDHFNEVPRIMPSEISRDLGRNLWETPGRPVILMEGEQRELLLVIASTYMYGFKLTGTYFLDFSVILRLAENSLMHQKVGEFIKSQVSHPDPDP